MLGGPERWEVGGQAFYSWNHRLLALTGPRCQGEQKRIHILPIVDLGSAPNISTPQKDPAATERTSSLGILANTL